MDKKYIHQYILAYTIIIGFCVLTVYILHLVHSGMQIQDTTGSVFMLMGTVSTAFGIIVQYFFGSTRGSAEKSALIAQLSQKDTNNDTSDTVDMVSKS